MERLAMLHSHLRERSMAERTSEFPQLPAHERAKWEGTDFHVRSFQIAHLFVDGQASTHRPVLHLSGRETGPIPGHVPMGKFSFEKINCEIAAISGCKKSTTETIFVDKLFASEIIEENKIAQLLIVGDLDITIDVLMVSEKEKATVLRLDNIDDALEYISEWDEMHSAIVSLSHIDSAGNLLDVKRACKRIKCIIPGATVALNVSKTIGIEDIQLEEWDIDIGWFCINSSDSQFKSHGVDKTGSIFAVVITDSNNLKIPEQRSSNDMDVLEITFGELADSKATLNQSKADIDSFRERISSDFKVVSPASQYVVTVAERKPSQDTQGVDTSDQSDIVIHHFGGPLNATFLSDSVQDPEKLRVPY